MQPAMLEIQGTGEYVGLDVEERLNSPHGKAADSEDAPRKKRAHVGTAKSSKRMQPRRLSDPQIPRDAIRLAPAPFPGAPYPRARHAVYQKLDRRRSFSDDLSRDLDLACRVPEKELLANCPWSSEVAVGVAVMRKSIHEGKREA
ncbi:hypothetical protein BD414DRAFT_214840 [Trametes punicea]|nr:hypothetical protein BD414DRAFT_214840 [Trametes punicea]